METAPSRSSCFMIRKIVTICRVSSRTLAYFGVLLGVSVMTTALTYRRLLAMQNVLERSHPLALTMAQRRRRLHDVQNRLQYLSFTSVDYTAFSSEEDEPESYPSRLDPNAVAIALPPKYADLAASCTQSMVGSDTHPHVVTFEVYGGFNRSHQLLLSRLRERFPKALFVLMEMVDPTMRLVLSSTNQTIAELILDIGHNSQESSVRALVESLLLRNDRFELLPSQSTQTIEQSIRDDPWIVQYNLADHWDPSNISSFLDLFTADLRILSLQGHLQLYLDVRSVVEDVLPVLGKENEPPSIGTWGTGDACHIWYATGQYHLESSARQVELPLNESSSSYIFSGAHKHALEFSKRDGSQSNNKITVHNPFSQDRLLSLTYLTDRNSMRYPKTRVFLNDQPTVLLLPFHDEQRHRHIARTTGVGYVPPGKSTVSLEPLQESKLPFRLLGASLLAEEADGLDSMEFAFESDSIVASDDDLVGSSNQVLSTLFQ